MVGNELRLRQQKMRLIILIKIPRKRTQNKTEANTPSWYKKYLTDLDQKVKASNEKYQGLTLEDVLKDFKEKE